MALGRTTARAMIRVMDLASKDAIKRLEALPPLHPDRDNLEGWYEIRRRLEQSKIDYGYGIKRGAKSRAAQPTLSTLDPGVVWGRA